MAKFVQLGRSALFINPDNVFNVFIQRKVSGTGFKKDAFIAIFKSPQGAHVTIEYEKEQNMLDDLGKVIDDVNKMELKY